MRTVTFLQLRTDARLYADQRETGANVFISDTELKRLSNQTLAGLYDLIVRAGGKDYYASEGTLSIVSGTARYSLPATFYEMLSVTLEWSATDHEVMGPISAARDRANFVTENTNFSSRSRKAYWIRGQQLEIVPTPTAAVTARLQFVPTYTDLVNDGDTFDGVNGWEKLAALGIAMQMRAIEEQPYGDLAGLYEAELNRIEGLISERDAGENAQIVDVQPEERTVWAGRFNRGFLW